MNAADAPAAGPTNAEQILSVLTRADSLTLTTDGSSYALVGLHTLDGRGRLRLRLPADSPLAAQAACAPRGILAALLEFTDIAPTAVRDRVRARVTLSGWLTPWGSAQKTNALELRLDPARATLGTTAGTVVVGLDELILAEADPLAAAESPTLAHLAGAHDDVVTRLTRLADPRLLHGVVRVQPLALDQYGITLRYEYARGQRDVRIVFPSRVREPAQAGEQIRQLLAAARACPNRRRAVSGR